MDVGGVLTVLVLVILLFAVYSSHMCFYALVRRFLLSRCNAYFASVHPSPACYFYSYCESCFLTDSVVPDCDSFPDPGYHNCDFCCDFDYRNFCSCSYSCFDNSCSYNSLRFHHFFCLSLHPAHRSHRPTDSPLAPACPNPPGSPVTATSTDSSRISGLL